MGEPLQPYEENIRSSRRFEHARDTASFFPTLKERCKYYWLVPARMILLISFYCAYLFIACEILSRILLPRLLTVNSKFIASTCDSMLRMQWIDRHRTDNVQIYYSFDVYHQTRGWALKPNLRNFPCFENKTVNSNSKGVRGLREFDFDKPPAKKRIITLGDSYTFGDEVNDDETWPSYLQKKIPEVEIINLGVHGYGHDQMLIYLEEEGLKYKPAIVMLGFISYDIERNILSFRDYAKPKFELRGNNIALVNTPVPTIESTLRREIWRSKFLDLASLVYNALWQRTPGYQKSKYTITNAILNRMVSSIRKANAIPVFLYLSSVQTMDQSDVVTPEESVFSKRWEAKGVKCVILRLYARSAMRQGKKIKEQGQHFDAMTNEIIADGIKSYLDKNNLIGTSDSAR